MNGIRVRGLDQVVDALQQLGDDLAEFGPYLAVAVEPAAIEAASRAPRLSGELASSMELVIDGEVVTVTFDLVYAGVQAYGWPGHNIAASGFTDPLDNGIDTLADRADDELQQLIDLAGLN